MSGTAAPSIDSLLASAQGASARSVVALALDSFGDDVAIAFSGAEDVVLIEYAHQLGRHPRVFALDTGRLHSDTLRYFETVAKHYDLRIEFCTPDRALLEPFVRTKGLFSFYEDGHHECCNIRKVEPLERQLGTLRAWISGQRRDQSPGTRSDVPLVEIDARFRGAKGAQLVKFNPLAETTSAEVWATIRAFEVPYNPLHERGMISIGCEPCTRAILPGQHEREGRWWWEEATKKECGLHLKPPAT